MIVSELVETEKLQDNILIEQALRNLGIEPLRWAVVEVLQDRYKISVSYEK